MSKISRRSMLHQSAAGLVSSSIASSTSLATVSPATASPPSGPVILSKKRRVVRVLGTHVTLQEELRKQAEADLGIELQFSPGGSAEVLHQASVKPESFDLYEQWSNSIRVLWQANAIQPIETERIENWGEINQLTKTGRLTPDAKLGAGDAPNRILFIQPDQTLGSDITNRVSFLPYVHNVDSFGYDAGKIERGTAYQSESWGWLLEERFHGKVAIVNEPSIGLFDLALAVQAKGLVAFNDIGNISREELDEMFGVLMKYRRSGHFRGIWSSVPASIKLMHTGESTIQSMFSPAVFDLRARGIDCVYASPREGYRAWHGVMCLSSATNGTAKDAAYEYMNWWLSGWPGAFIARQGYYISNPQRSRPMLSDAEWDYWYRGKPASEDLMGTAGGVVAEEGMVRDGGSYERRFSNIAVWNTVMPTYEYSLRRWNEFLSS